MNTDRTLRELVRRMHESGLSQAELSRRTSVPRTTVRKLMSGKHTNPTIRTVGMLSDFLDEHERGGQLEPSSTGEP